MTENPIKFNLNSPDKIYLTFRHQLSENGDACRHFNVDGVLLGAREKTTRVENKLNLKDVRDFFSDFTRSFQPFFCYLWN